MDAIETYGELTTYLPGDLNALVHHCGYVCVCVSVFELLLW